MQNVSTWYTDEEHMTYSRTLAVRWRGVGRELVGEGEKPIFWRRACAADADDVVEKGGRAEKGCVCLLRRRRKEFHGEIQEARIVEWASMMHVLTFSLGPSHWYSLMFWVRFCCAGFIKIPRELFFPGQWHILNRTGGNCYLLTTHVKTQKLSGPGRGQRAACRLREGGACHSRWTCPGTS